MHLIVLSTLVMMCVWRSVCACSFVWLLKGVEFSPGFSTPIRMFAIITQEYFKNIFRLKMENCLHGCFPGNNVCKIFWKIFFIDYLPATAFIDNDEITQATRTGFLKRSLKPERGGGDLLKCLRKISVNEQSTMGQKICKIPSGSLWNAL